MQASIAGVINDLRRITTELRPPLLEREGLGPALRALFFEFGDAYGLELELDDGTRGEAPTEASAIAYRVIFEIVVTVRDAGGHHRVHAALRADGHTIEATVLVDETTPGPSTIGARISLDLEMVGELLGSLGGSLDISSSAHETTVRAVIPHLGL